MAVNTLFRYFLLLGIAGHLQCFPLDVWMGRTTSLLLSYSGFPEVELTLPFSVKSINIFQT